VRQTCREAARARAQTNLALTAELLALLATLNAERCRVVPWRGPVAAAAYYGDLGRREFWDLDLCTRPEDVRGVAEVLQARGYVPEVKTHVLQADAFIRQCAEVQFVHEETGGVVELQWRFAPTYLGFGLTPEAAWERLRAMTLQGHDVPALVPEDLLLALCVHGTKHVWERLAWVLDIALLLQAERELDWDVVVARAVALRARRALALGVTLARDLLDAPAPAAAGCEPGLAAAAVRHMLGRRHGLAGRCRFHLAARDGLVARARYLTGILTPTERDWAWWTPPAGLRGALYLLRPVRVLLNNVGRTE
jgi:hypothetical protein